MEILKPARAGSLESSDILIMIHPSDEMIIEINSKVKDQFGDQIEKVINDTLNSLSVKNAKVIANDNGALDFTICARVKTAVNRSRVGDNHA